MQDNEKLVERLRHNAACIRATGTPLFCDLMDEATTTIETQAREIAELKRRNRLGEASTYIVGQLAAMIPLNLTLDKTATAGKFIAYFNAVIAERDQARAEVERLREALKGIMVRLGNLGLTDARGEAALAKSEKPDAP